MSKSPNVPVLDEVMQQQRAMRQKLIEDLKEVCERDSISVDNSTVLHLHDLCRRAHEQLVIPERAAMQIIIGCMEWSAEILKEREAQLG